MKRKDIGIGKVIKIYDDEIVIKDEDTDLKYKCPRNNKNIKFGDRVLVYLWFNEHYCSLIKERIVCPYCGGLGKFPHKYKHNEYDLCDACKGEIFIQNPHYESKEDK